LAVDKKSTTQANPLCSHKTEGTFHMELKKYHASEILHIIRHNARSLPDGTYGNSSIIPELKT